MKSRFFVLVVCLFLSTPLLGEEKKQTIPLKDRIRKTFSDVYSTPFPGTPPASVLGTPSPGVPPASVLGTPSPSSFSTSSSGMPGLSLSGNEKPVKLASFTVAFFPFGASENQISDFSTDLKPVSDAEQFYSLSVTEKEILILDALRRRVLSFSTDAGNVRTYLRDPRGLINISDFAVLAENTVAIADNTRHAVYFFRNNRFSRAVGLIEDRELFQFIQHIFADETGRMLGVYDSAKNRSFVFDLSGNLLWEVPGPAQPSFFQGNLVRVIKNDKRVQLFSVSREGNRIREIINYSPREPNIVLDAWVAGAESDLIVFAVTEGKGNEDQPDMTRVIALRGNKFTSGEIPASLDLDPTVKKPFRLFRRNRIPLPSRDGGVPVNRPDGDALAGLILEPVATDSGLTIIGYQLP